MNTARQWLEPYRGYWTGYLSTPLGYRAMYRRSDDRSGSTWQTSSIITDTIESAQQLAHQIIDAAFRMHAEYLLQTAGIKIEWEPGQTPPACGQCGGVVYVKQHSPAIGKCLNCDNEVKLV